LSFSTPTNHFSCQTKVSYRLSHVLVTVLAVTEARRFIAVVDDEPAVCKALERLLRSAKFEVATFCSGTAFLASLSVRRPDCVVLDLHMPGMNGFEVQSRLGADPVGEIGVVIITAHDSSESQERAIAGGAVAYLRKPVDAQPLLEAVRTAIPRKDPPTSQNGAG